MREASVDMCVQEARTPMGRLVLLCSRAGLVDDFGSLAELKELLVDEAMPWEDVVVTLTGHGLSIVFRELVTQGGLESLLPAPVLETLDAQRIRNIYEALFSEAALRGIGDACSAKGVELMLLKGLFLSKVVYEVSDVRPVGDIDLLIRREDSDAFREVLGSLGYREYNEPTRLFWERPTEYHTFKGGGPPEMSLDVHTLVVPEQRFRVWQGGAGIETMVWQESLPEHWRGEPFREMRPEHLLIYLCLHATVRHTFARAFWLVDLRETLRHYADVIDYDVLCECAHEWHLATFVYMALRAAELYATAKVPPAAMDGLRPAYRGAHRFEELLEEGAAIDLLKEVPVPRAERHMALLRDTWPARAQAVLTLPYHQARRAFRHWRPWVDLKRRQELRSGGESAQSAPLEPTATSVAHLLWSGGVGGAERAVYQLVRAQRSDPDLRVAVVFGCGGGPYVAAIADCGCEVVDARFRWGGDPFGVLRLSRMLRGYDVHHFHTPQPAMVVASLLAGKRTRVYTHRGGAFDYDLRRRIREAVMGVMLRRGFDAFSGNTRHAARVAADRHRIAPERFAVTYNGLEFALLEPERDSLSVRHELGLPADAVVVGTAANLRPIKRIDRLIEAASALRDEGVWLLILGDGPAKDELRLQAERLGIVDRVCFAGVRARVGDYLSAMDVFVLPTGPEESFGNAAVEAMALAVPTVVFADGGGLVEHIDDRVTGFIVDDTDHLQLILQELSRDAQLRRKIGAQGAQAVRSRYTTLASASAYKKLYAQALAHRGLRAAPAVEQHVATGGGSAVAFVQTREGQSK